MSLIEQTIEIYVTLEDPPVIYTTYDEFPLISVTVDLDNFADVSHVGGIPTKFGQVASPFVFAKATAGQKKSFGVISRSTTFTKSVAGSVMSGDPTIYGNGNYGVGLY